MLSESHFKLQFSQELRRLSEEKQVEKGTAVGEDSEEASANRVFCGESWSYTFRRQGHALEGQKWHVLGEFQ